MNKIKDLSVIFGQPQTTEEEITLQNYQSLLDFELLTGISATEYILTSSKSLKDAQSPLKSFPFSRLSAKRFLEGRRELSD